MIKKNAETEVKINEILAKRWSPRAFNPDAQISKEQILSLCEAARWAPSAYNDQPFKFIIFDKFQNPEQWEKAFNCLIDWNKGWVKNATIIVAVFYSTQFKHNGSPNPTAMYDAGAASENMCLQATDLGLVAHQMSGFDYEKIAQDFDIPENYKPITMIAFGYQADADILDAPYKDRELENRTRLAVSELFCDGDWNKPLK